MTASEELMDAMQEDFEGTQVRRRTRRRVLSDDDFPLAQVLPVFSHMASRRVVLVPGDSGDTPRSGPDRSDSGEGGDATQFAHQEAAPNVVDATAVELPSSPHTSVVDALELDLSVPAFDPMESNEEDEHDTCVPSVPVSGSVRESHGFRRLVLVSNTVDASRRVEVVGRTPSQQ